MEFIRKLFPPKEEPVEMVSKAAYDITVRRLETQCRSALDELEKHKSAVAFYADRGRQYRSERDTARAEAAANAADAEKWRAARDRRKRSARPRVKAEVA